MTRHAYPGVLSRAESEALARHVLDMIGEAPAAVEIGSGAGATTSFARGDTHLASQSNGLAVILTIKGATVSTTRLDDAGLQAAIGQVRVASRQVRGKERSWRLIGPQQYATPPKLVFESVESAMTNDTRAALTRRALDATDAANLIGAGDIECSTSSRYLTNTEGLSAYIDGTYGEFSLTARTKDGTGSGWGWTGHEDWARVDPAAAIERAVDLARRSANPVAVEPGRYTVILEPAAAAAMMAFDWSAWSADNGESTFSKDPLGTNKIGLKMLDERVSIVADPWDPNMPRTTIATFGEPVNKMVMFERGVLRNLAYDHWYARRKNREPLMPSEGFRMSLDGPKQTLEEMIASTKRGIWVNRFSNTFAMDPRSLLLTGTTRDGTFLIENGKITKAIKNLRFTESPFFVFNRVDAAGEPVRASRYWVVPRLKVRDFEFTSLTDAV